MKLSDRVDDGAMGNEMDVLIEVALFEPDTYFAECRANAAGTKIIYRTESGREITRWAREWTEPGRRTETIAALRARGL